MRNASRFVPPFEAADSINMACSPLHLRDFTLGDVHGKGSGHISPDATQTAARSRYMPWSTHGRRSRTRPKANEHGEPLVLWLPLAASQLDVNSNIVHLRDPRPSSGLNFPVTTDVGDTHAVELQPGLLHAVPADLSGFLLGGGGGNSGDGDDVPNVVLVGHVRRMASDGPREDCDAATGDAEQEAEAWCERQQEHGGQRKANENRSAHNAGDDTVSLFHVKWRDPHRAWKTHAVLFPHLCTSTVQVSFSIRSSAATPLPPSPISHPDHSSSHCVAPHHLPGGPHLICGRFHLRFPLMLIHRHPFDAFICRQAPHTYSNGYSAW